MEIESKRPAGPLIDLLQPSTRHPIRKDAEVATTRYRHLYAAELRRRHRKLDQRALRRRHDPARLRRGVRNTVPVVTNGEDGRVVLETGIDQHVERPK